MPLLQSYCENPTNCRFEGQDKHEKILLLLRAHPITNLRWLIPALFFMFLPLLLLNIQNLINIQFPSLPSDYVPALLIINYLLVIIIAFQGFLHWYFNVYIITDQNIVDIDFHSLLSKNVDFAPLENVEEASGSMAGILGIFFHFGNVNVQTAGTQQTIDFVDVPRPVQVADFIMDHRPGGGR